MTVSCKLIPLALKPAEQAAILDTVAESTPHGSSVTFDITHGLRHLPILALLSAIHLRQAKNAHIQGIYYGALEAESNSQATVVKLDFALDTIRWIDAVSVVNRTGNLSALKDLPGIPDETGARLERTGYLENINQIAEARRPAAAALQEIAHSDLSFSAALYRDLITKQLRWANESNYAERQLALAENALDNSDYLQCSILACEAAVSAEMPGRGADPLNYDLRREFREGLAQERIPEYRQLTRLRNAIVHGTRSTDAEIQRLLSSEEALRNCLANLLKWVAGRVHDLGR